MSIEDLKNIIYKELNQYHKEKLNDYFQESIDISMFTVSGGTNWYLLSMISENEIWDISVLICGILITTWVIYRNHDKYKLDVSTKEKIKLFKQIRKDIKMGINRFENVETDDFEKEYIKIYCKM